MYFHNAKRHEEPYAFKYIAQANTNTERWNSFFEKRFRAERGDQPVDFNSFQTSFTYSMAVSHVGRQVRDE